MNNEIKNKIMELTHQRRYLAYLTFDDFQKVRYLMFYYPRVN